MYGTGSSRILSSGFYAIVPGCLHPGGVILLSQHTVNDMTGWSLEVENCCWDM